MGDVSPDSAGTELAARSARRSFLDDVIVGLSQRRKTIPAKYFYDARGSELYDRITQLDEYYPSRTELSILCAHARDIGDRIGPAARVVELGSGSANKTRALLGGLNRPAQYVLVDISRDPLVASAARLAAEFPALDVRALCADYTYRLALPACAATRTVAYFPGSTIGNFTPEEARDFLARVRGMVGAGGALVVGADLPKDPALLHAAYNDAAGVTAAFNKNLLARMNAELFARFDLGRFFHYAFYEPSQARVEMHLVSAETQRVPVAGRAFAFAEGESIVSEYSYKHSLEGMARLAAQAGFAVDGVWLDPKRWFSVQLLRAGGGGGG
jgi:L-histidine Nalpha-methyltransferase